MAQVAYRVMYRGVVASFIASLVLTGCGTPPRESFLGASIPRLTYGNLSRPGTPLRLQLTVEFQRNGQPFPKGDVPLRDYASQILRDSGVIAPVSEFSPAGGTDGTVRLVLNNIADSGTVAAQTPDREHPLWMQGTTLTDAYELSMFVTTARGTVSRTGIKHAVHTAVGNMRVPEGIQVFPREQGFGKVLEQMILRALADLQESGELVETRLHASGGKGGKQPRPRALAGHAADEGRHGGRHGAGRRHLRSVTPDAVAAGSLPAGAASGRSSRSGNLPV